MTKTEIRKVIPNGWRELEQNEIITANCNWFNGNCNDMSLVGGSIGRKYWAYTGEKFWIIITKSPKPMNTNNLTVTKEKVLEAANKCSQAKEVLKTLFPEVFEDDGSVQVNYDFITNKWNIENRTAGEYAGKAIWLSDRFNWEIKKDRMSQLCLIPTKK